MGSPVALAIAKSAVAPKFSGLRAEWLEFKNRWNHYFEVITTGSPEDARTKLNLLEPCLDETSQKQIRMLRLRPGGITFSEIWERLEKQFGGEDFTARTRWNNLRLETGGKLTPKVWRAFVTDFEELRTRLPNLTEEEAYSLLIKQIPQIWAEKIVEDQFNEGRRRPRLRMEGLKGFSEEAVRQFLRELLGQSPQRIVLLRDGVYQVDTHDETMAANLRRLHGHEIVDGPQLVVQPIDFRRTPDEIISWMDGKLRVREHTDGLRNQNQGEAGTSHQQFKQERWQSRNIRLVETEAEEETTISMVSKGVEGKKKNSSTPTAVLASKGPTPTTSSAGYQVSAPSAISAGLPYSPPPTSAPPVPFRASRGYTRDEWAPSYSNKGKGKGTGKTHTPYYPFRSRSLSQSRTPPTTGKGYKGGKGAPHTPSSRSPTPTREHGAATPPATST